MKNFLDNWLGALQLIITVTALIWCAALLNYLSGYTLSQFGIYPREVVGLVGILFWVLLHGDFTHIVLNTSPLLFMGFFVALRGPVLYFKITVLVWLVAGLAVWVFGRPAIHIGASGLVFGYFGFILAVAVYERSIFDLAVASVTIFYYGGLFFGIFPLEQFVSWESHLSGFLAGILAARLFGKDWVKAP
ncbi:MAG: rhomboid family intramembrane serine protease [Gammaproteobacteria bacterium]|jgi:membrane associated rhomboid family serine protease|nr:rhomboid family intramembrane serine protease [Gammaproteobacteria bacterium]MBT4493542.1 rhomboid family intramembrane serine protease [Gammaproteobacteria bacterium]MBT7370992.1 rhomboid family intramembrane serine protease [Gammaproteobacteria bacterium]